MDTLCSDRWEKRWVTDTPAICPLELEKTLAYARMVERSGCSVLAVHGRTRDQKDASGIRADWDAIKAVKAALSIPVLANGDIRDLKDVHDCMQYTGCDGVLSAESLLVDPALFAPSRLLPGVRHHNLQGSTWPQTQWCLTIRPPMMMVFFV